jgi:hypothetical protein
MNAPARQKDFVIETGIALPPPRRGPGRVADPNSLAGVLRRLEVGQSVLIAGRTSETRRMGSRFVRLKPKKFATRLVEGGVRIWRTA